VGGAAGVAVPQQVVSFRGERAAAVVLDQEPAREEDGGLVAGDDGVAQGGGGPPRASGDTSAGLAAALIALRAIVRDGGVEEVNRACVDYPAARPIRVVAADRAVGHVQRAADVFDPAALVAGVVAADRAVGHVQRAAAAVANAAAFPFGGVAADR